MIDFATTAAWQRDPKHLVFSLARYKFVAKMIAGMGNVLEVGAGDGVQGRIVSQFVGVLTQTDKEQWNPVNGPYVEIDRYGSGVAFDYDAIYALDVLEHVSMVDEDAFMRGICASLSSAGTSIIGMPSLESQIFASFESKAEHVNCKTEHDLRELMRKYFQCVYIFGMNDEVVHTGFGPMCQYRFAVCNTKR